MTIPYQYQIEGAQAMHDFGGRVLLADEMGLGKSLETLLYAQLHPKARPILIVCPASLKWNWAHEVTLHTNLRSEILEGTKPGKEGLLKTCPILIINYDILGAWLFFLLELQPQLLILDEVHYIKNRFSKRSKAVKILCKQIPHVLALSGTPLTNRPVELWPVLNCLRPDLYPSFMAYGQRYCGPRRVPWGSGWEFKGATHLGELHRSLLQKVMIRRRKADVLSQLPEKQRITVALAISDRKQYDYAVQDFISWLAQYDPAKLSSAQRAERLVRMGYLKRLAGLLKLTFVMDWIDDFLEDSDGKLVLFALHKKVIRGLAKRYHNLCIVVDGSITGKERQLSVQKFQSNSATRLFIGNLKAAGVGLNLTAATTVAFAEMSWTPGEHVQAEDRCHRIGTKSAVSVYYLIGKDTVEEYLAKLIQEKHQSLNSVLDNGRVQHSLDIFDQLSKAILKQQRG